MRFKGRRDRLYGTRGNQSERNKPLLDVTIDAGFHRVPDP